MVVYRPPCSSTEQGSTICCHAKGFFNPGKWIGGPWRHRGLQNFTNQLLFERSIEGTSLLQIKFRGTEPVCAFELWNHSATESGIEDLSVHYGLRYTLEKQTADYAAL